MVIFFSLIGAVVVTAIWMLGLSYVDYLVARYQRSGRDDKGRVQTVLVLQRTFGLPWTLSSALIAMTLVLVALWVVGMILEVVGFVLLSLAGPIVIGICVMSDWRLLQAPPPPRTPSPSPAALAQLYGIRGEYAGTCFDLDGRDVTIGRSEQSMIRLRDKRVSRNHTRIRYAQGRFFLQDQNSTRGTLLNGHPIKAGELNNGDRISICYQEFEFRRSLH